MGYTEALEKAGCKIIKYEEFGCYQGTWLAFVKYKGEKGIVQGSFGSCSVCDAFQSEFDYCDSPSEIQGKFYKTPYIDEYEEITKEEFDNLLLEIEPKFIDFGNSYLAGGLYDKQFYLTKLEKLDENEWFDEEEKEYCLWAINQDWN